MNMKVKNFRTAIKIITPTSNTQDSEGWNEENVTISEIIYCDWKNAFGNEIYNLHAIGAMGGATIRTWYDDRITANVRILHVDSNEEYEVNGFVDNINDESQYMEVKLKKYIKG